MANKKAHITFAGYPIDFIINEISVSNDREHNTSNFIGSKGSTTNYISSSSRILSFSSLCKHDEKSKKGLGHRINDYKWLSQAYNNTAKVLTSPSQSKLKGNYLCTNFNYTEDTTGNYVIDWEFREVEKFNATRKTFRVWGKAVSSSNKAKKTTAKTSGANNLNSNVKLLLKSCPLMSKGYKGKKCVKSLQKFLQSKGYYTKYKVDGVYEKYTEQELKKLQKKIKVKATGKWDKNTRAYFQKKYKYPTTNTNKSATAIISSNIRV